MQGKRAELIYGDATVKDLVDKDTDKDGIPDWEEPLYGLDPTKKETTPGVPDSTAMAKLKANQGQSATANGAEGAENLTETDKFSRELFSTTATLNQNGVMDQTTTDKISGSLADKIKNPVVRKVYTLADLKIIEDNSTTSIKKYYDASNKIHIKYPTKGSVLDVLQKFIIDENNVDVSALAGLDPIIKQQQGVISEMIKMSVPSGIAQAHLDIINGLERLLENANDIKLYETDPILTMSAVSNYTKNTTSLDSAIKNIANLILEKLNN